jgi:hypothetical protein
MVTLKNVESLILKQLKQLREEEKWLEQKLETFEEQSAATPSDILRNALMDDIYEAAE